MSALDELLEESSDEEPYFDSSLTSIVDSTYFAGQTRIRSQDTQLSEKKRKLEEKLIAEKKLLDSVRFGNLMRTRDCLTVHQKMIKNADDFFDTCMKINSKFLKR